MTEQEVTMGKGGRGGTSTGRANTVAAAKQGKPAPAPRGGKFGGGARAAARGKR